MIPAMVSVGSRRATAQSGLQFDQWIPDIGITRDGKHIHTFRQDFPLVIFSYSFPYYYNNVPNYHDYLEVSYNCAGTGTYHVSNHLYPFAPGDLAIIGSNEIHCLRASAKVNLDLFSVFFMPDVVCPRGVDALSWDLTRPFFDGTRHVLKAVEYDHARLLKTMLEMRGLDQQKPTYYRLHLRHLLYELLLQLLHHYDDRHLFALQPGSHTRREANTHRLNPVFSWVEDHYREHITLEQAARMASMSRNYFCRFFRNATGSSFVDYLNTFRINRAKELIKSSDLTTTQVASQVGYNNLGYFFRSFKRYVHLSPGEFLSMQEE